MRLDRVALAAIFLCIFALAVFDVQGADVWWHLATGRYILGTWAIPTRDPFSYTAQAPWVAHEWLSGVLYALLFDWFGIAGLIVFNASLITLYSYVGYRLAARYCGQASAAFLVFLVALAIRGEERFFIRPDNVSVLFVGFYLFIFTAWRKEWRRTMVAVSLLQVAWCNLHGGGSILGVALATSFFVGDACECTLRRSSGATAHDVKWRGAIVAATVGLSVANPYGWKVPLYFLNAFSGPFGSILEWRPSAVEDFIGSAGIVVATAFVAVVLWGRAVSVAEIVAFALMAALGSTRARFIPFTLMAALPLAGLGAGRVTALVRAVPRLSPSVGAMGMAAAVMLYTVGTLVSERRGFAMPYRPGLSVNSYFVPVDAVDFLEGSGLRGPIFNSYRFGGYLIWRLYPREKVFIDGRTDLYGDDLIARYRSYGTRDGWRALADRYAFNLAIVDNEPAYAARGVDEDAAWALVYWDDRALVYAKRTRINCGLINRARYRYLKPNNRDYSYLTAYLHSKSDRDALLAELDRNVDHAGNFVDARLMRAFVLERLNSDSATSQAISDYEAVARLLPDRSRLWRQIGALYLSIGQYAAARSALERSIALDGTDFEAHHRLSVAYWCLGDKERAIRECRAALRLDPWSADALRNLDAFTHP